MWQYGAAESGGGRASAAEEAIVRNPVRKLVGVALMGVLGALFALPMLAAGAQEFIPGEGPPPTPECNITSFSPDAPVPQASFPVTVTVAGTVDTAATLTLYGATPPTAAPVVLNTQAVSPGAFSISGSVGGPSKITLGITYGPENAYAAACAAAGGVTEFNVEAQVATKPPTSEPPTGAALAFTGSSDTPSYVLIGLAAVVVGAVLVVAARRRSQVS
jgi:LPXTG-motif cell wall-anchored protein